MNDLMWYLTRSTGIVGVALAVASLIWGFLFLLARPEPDADPTGGSTCTTGSVGWR